MDLPRLSSGLRRVTSPITRRRRPQVSQDWSCQGLQVCLVLPETENEVPRTILDDYQPIVSDSRMAMEKLDSQLDP